MMTSLLLHHGTAKLALRPDIGGSIEGLWFDDLEIMRSVAPGTLANVKQSASYPFVPYSNRIANARLHWQDVTYPLNPNFAPEPHAIHGVGWLGAWGVHKLEADFAHLTFTHTAEAATQDDWPFAFDAWQTFKLTAHTLDMTIGMTNRSAHVVPAGLGWHPYFVKRSQSQLNFDAAGRWEMDAAKLPTTFSTSGGLQVSGTTLDVDHCYDEWAGTVHLRDECMDVRITSALKRLVVYTTLARDSIAIEPVSHVNNAMNQANASALGVQLLQPGQSYAASMTVEMHAL
jgi:aldose 1-epimerase